MGVPRPCIIACVVATGCSPLAQAPAISSEGTAGSSSGAAAAGTTTGAVGDDRSSTGEPGGSSSDGSTSAAVASASSSGAAESTSAAATTTGQTESGTTAASEPSMDGVRIEMPCLDGADCFDNPFICPMDQSDMASTTLNGEMGQGYEVTLRVRGVVETAPYEGGVAAAAVYIGGGPSTVFNPISLTISDPAQTIWLNFGVDDLWIKPLDYTFTLEMSAGATATLLGDSGNDQCGVKNLDMGGTPLVVDMIDPAPEPFAGQFVQVDVEGILPL